MCSSDLRYMACSYIEKLRAVEDSQSPYRVVVVGKRFSLPHEHHVRYAPSEIVLHGKNLVDYFPGIQASCKPRFSCSAKRFRHPYGHFRAIARGLLEGTEIPRARDIHHVVERVVVLHIGILVVRRADERRVVDDRQAKAGVRVLE